MPSSDLPAPDFRRKLHRALERTHRQHAAQRVLGTRRMMSAPVRRPRRWPWLLVLLLLGLAAGIMLSRHRCANARD